MNYRVPYSGYNSSIWSRALGHLGPMVDGPWDVANHGSDFGSDNGDTLNHQMGTDHVIWYPGSGYRTYNDGIIERVDEIGEYWTNASYYDPLAYSVRCMKESK